jgi:hypothetical protein
MYEFIHVKITQILYNLIIYIGDLPYSVPGLPIVGGTLENQIHSTIFTQGEALQTINMKLGKELEILLYF